MEDVMVRDSRSGAEDLSSLISNYGNEIRQALLIRGTEETLLSLFAAGKLNGTVHTCVGQEFTGVFIARHLNSNDYVVSNHRGHGHYIARTGDVKGLVAEVMGRTTGSAGGIGGSQHLVNEHYLSNGIQGGMTPVTSGIALALKMQNIDGICVAFIGDGTLGEGTLYETLNIASAWGIPILFVCEHNSYAQSTHSKQTFAGSVATRMEGFGIKYIKADTWNLETLDHNCSEAVGYVRDRKKPVFLEIETYRLNSHSKGDDNRHPEEVINYKDKDILSKLINTGDPEVKEWQERIQKEIDEAVLFAEASPVLSHFPNDSTCLNEPVTYSPIKEAKAERVNQVIYETLKEQFAADATMVMIGEDIEHTTSWTTMPYGGAFKVSKDLSALFPGRVLNTPISEGAITGIGTGLAIGGMHPLVEIMFGDFMTLTLDQLLQHACKFKRMFNGKVKVPLIMRTPMGGKRGYGPTHSQSLEKFFLGIPDLTILALNHRISPKAIYQGIFNHISDPVLVIENKILYTRLLNEKPLPGFEISKSDEVFPTLSIQPQSLKAQVTVVCYGGTLEDVEAAIEMAFDEEEILCEVICPSCISPININPILSSVKRTGRLVIVEEGTAIAALGSEIAASLLQEKVVLQGFGRVSNNTIIPSAIDAEKNLLPNPKSILQMIKQVYNG